MASDITLSEVAEAGWQTFRARMVETVLNGDESKLDRITSDLCEVTYKAGFDLAANVIMDRLGIPEGNDE